MQSIRLMTSSGFRALCVLAPMILIGCKSDVGPADQSPSAETKRHTLLALQLVANGKAIRWLAKKEMCVPPFDAADYPRCFERPINHISPALYQFLREKYPEDSTSHGYLSCVHVSREIEEGDSTFIAVVTVGSTVADGLVEQIHRRVYFKRGPHGDTAWIELHSASSDSDGEPLRNRFQCDHE